MYRIREGKPIIVLGDGTSLWGYAHRDDVGRAIAHAVGNEKAYGQGYTIAPKEVMTWEQVYETLAEAMGAPKPEFVHVPYFILDRLTKDPYSWNRLNFRFNNIYDTNKAERDLGYAYTITWKEGAQRMARTHERMRDITEAADDPRYDEIVEKVRAMYASISEE